MKNVTLHISEDVSAGATANGVSGTRAITVSFGRDNYDPTILTVGVNSPRGYTMSAAQATQVNNLLGDAYEHILGSPTFSVTRVNSSVADMLATVEDVNQVIKYRED